METFDPDTAGMAEIYRYYRSVSNDDQSRVAAERYLAAIEHDIQFTFGDSLIQLWLKAHELSKYLGNQTKGIEYLTHAVNAQPANFHGHKRLASYLIETDRHQEALEQLQWCYQRRPGDPWVRDKLYETRRRTISRRMSES